MKANIYCLRLAIVCIFLLCCSIASAQQNVRITYLWDVTLSMSGYNGAPNIYDKVVNVMIKDLNAITDQNTEIVVIPFQDTEYCEVWRAKATPDGKAQLSSLITNYKNDKVTNTNISAPIMYVANNILTPDKLDILKLMTDGTDNVDFPKFKRVLAQWCSIAQSKNAYGYYILLTESATNPELSLTLSETCHFEEINAVNGLDAIAKIRQLNTKWKDQLLINIRDEYNQPKTLNFEVSTGDENLPSGFRIHFKTTPNPYLEIDQIVEMQPNLTVTLTPKFLKSQDQLMQELPTDTNYNQIELTYTPVPEMEQGTFALTKLADQRCNIALENKPVKTVRIYVKK